MQFALSSINRSGPPQGHKTFRVPGSADKRLRSEKCSTKQLDMANCSLLIKRMTTSGNMYVQYGRRADATFAQLLALLGLPPSKGNCKAPTDVLSLTVDMPTRVLHPTHEGLHTMPGAQQCCGLLGHRLYKLNQTPQCSAASTSSPKATPLKKAIT